MFFCLFKVFLKWKLKGFTIYLKILTYFIKFLKGFGL